MQHERLQLQLLQREALAACTQCDSTRRATHTPILTPAHKCQTVNWETNSKTVAFCKRVFGNHWNTRTNTSYHRGKPFMSLIQVQLISHFQRNSDPKSWMNLEFGFNFQSILNVVIVLGHLPTEYELESEWFMHFCLWFYTGSYREYWHLWFIWFCLLEKQRAVSLYINAHCFGRKWVNVVTNSHVQMANFAMAFYYCIVYLSFTIMANGSSSPA